MKNSFIGVRTQIFAEHIRWHDLVSTNISMQIYNRTYFYFYWDRYWLSKKLFCNLKCLYLLVLLSYIYISSEQYVSEWKIKNKIDVNKTRLKYKPYHIPQTHCFRYLILKKEYSICISACKTKTKQIMPEIFSSIPSLKFCVDRNCNKYQAVYMHK